MKYEFLSYSHKVRLARHSTSPNTLSSLVHYDDWEILAELINNTSLSRESFQFLIENTKNINIKINIFGKNQNIETYNILIKNITSKGDLLVFQQEIGYLTSSEEILVLLSKNSNSKVRAIVAQNSDTPSVVLNVLLSDKSKNVRDAAQ